MSAANHKLTGLISGRTISGSSQSGDETKLSFTDGSTMSVKTAPSDTNGAATGGTIDKVRQAVEPPVLFLDLTNGAALEIALAEPTSSVIIRDKDGTIEYVD